MTTEQIFNKLSLIGTNPGGFGDSWIGSGHTQKIISPINGEPIAEVITLTGQELEIALSRCHRASLEWRQVPAPKRGEVVKDLGREFFAHKQALAELITLEMGKCLRESLGEVQEMIDIFDFAVGLSRQLYGLTMPSERRNHRLQEQWHPLGLTAVITAFNFPAAVWSWNTALALVCGDTILWKPSSKTPLTAIACTKIAERVLKRNGYPPALCSLAIGSGNSIGDAITGDRRVALVSYTGSVSRGRGSRKDRPGTVRAARSGIGRKQRRDCRGRREHGHRAQGRVFRSHRHSRPTLHQHAQSYRPRIAVR